MKVKLPGTGRNKVSASKERASSSRTNTLIVGRSPRQIAWSRFKRNRVGMVAATISVSVIILSIGAPIFTRLFGVDPNTLHTNVLGITGVPNLPHGGISWSHPLGLLPGTGRDMLAQLLYGSRISFTVAILSTSLTLFIGLMMGIMGGFFRGRVDSVIGRVTDFLLSFPSFFMIVALSIPMVSRIEATGLVKGNGARVVFLIMFLSFFGWPYFSRIIRSQALSLRERDLPGYLAAESVYSFLGLGIQPPASTWGILLSNATRFVTVMPQFFLISAGSLVLVVLAFNLTGDALRDALDPRNER